VTGRATTPEQKRAIVERILAVWEKNPDLRLGQLILVNMNGLGDEHAARKLFYAEDEALTERLELLKGWEAL